LSEPELLAHATWLCQIARLCHRHHYRLSRAQPWILFGRTFGTGRAAALHGGNVATRAWSVRPGDSPAVLGSRLRWWAWLASP